MAQPMIALVDACVLCGPLKRNLLLSFAEAGLVQPRWSERIMDETESTIVKILDRQGFADAPERAARVRAMVARAFPDAQVDGYAHLGDAVGSIPDEGDRHVIAAAMKSKADVILTENLRDFPRKVLSRQAIEALPSDLFFSELIDINGRRATQAVDRLRRRFDRPAITPALFMAEIEKAQLTMTAGLLSAAGYASLE